MKEAKATLLAGHIVELTEAVAVSSTSIKLVWEVRIYILMREKIYERYFIDSSGFRYSTRISSRDFISIRDHWTVLIGVLIRIAC